MSVMNLDLSLNGELSECGTESLHKCLSDMQRYWAQCSATDTRKRKEWKEFLSYVEMGPLRFEINERRREIILMWERCFKSEKEKKVFTDFHSENYTKDLLESHERELEKLHAIYIQHRELIDLVTKYEEMWKSVVSIEEQAHNPERLFKNRGAQLLKEEQDRKLISKIPQMQNTILKAIKKKELDGTVFLIRGEHFSDIITRHNLRKEEKKTVKRTPMTSMLPGPSSKRSRTTDRPVVSDEFTNGHQKAKRQLDMK